jgi:hypothetical protein
MKVSITRIWVQTREGIPAKLEVWEAIFGGKLQELYFLEGK